MVSEITVIVKDEERNLRLKYLVYDPYAVDENDPIIKDCIDRTVAEFKGTPDSVKVKINLEIQ
jgi:hypothetical protein